LPPVEAYHAMARWLFARRRVNQSNPCEYHRPHATVHDSRARRCSTSQRTPGTVRGNFRVAPGIAL
jgi:hypothetical protein